MTPTKEQLLALAIERLTKAASGFPDHNDRDGVGWVRVRWDDLGHALAALQAAAERERSIRAILFADDGSDATLNLQGALYDLRGPFQPNDGGVCARTLDRVIGQLERARATLGESA